MIEVGFETRKGVGLAYVLDRLSPATPYGAERVRRLKFYAPGEREALEREWRNVAAAIGGLSENPKEYDRLRHLFMQVRDIRQTLRRCREMPLSEVELFEVKRFLLQLGLIAPLFAQIGDRYEGIAFTEEEGALALLDPDGRRAAGFTVAGPFAGDLSQIRERKRHVEMALREAPEGPARQALLAERRALVVREEDEALVIRKKLSEGIRPHLDALERDAEMIGTLDFTIERATLARARGATMPVLCEDGLRFTAMENPEIADRLAGQGRAFTRVGIEADQGVTVITGANMGGKSVALRTLSLQVLLCHAGFFAFAERAELPLFDEVHIISEDLSDSAAGLSSFGAEVVRLQQLLEAVQRGVFAFAALDEPARGTNPREGAALVRALVRRLNGARAVTVIATHYDGVASEAGAHYQAAGLRALPDETPTGDRLAFIARHMDYGLVRVDGAAETPKDALTICRLLGLNPVVVDEMEAFLR